MEIAHAIDFWEAITPKIKPSFAKSSGARGDPAAAMAKIFISYRREDASAYAGRLFDRLSAHFGRESVFIDVDTIAIGADFVDTIDEQVGSCDVLIALIGKRWLSCHDSEDRPRLSDPKDFVRLEIASALKRNVVVIPTLVDGAAMPGEGALPEPLKALARRNAFQIDHTRFHQDAGHLIELLEKIVGAPDAATTADGVGDRPKFRRMILLFAVVAVIVVGVMIAVRGPLSLPASADARQSAQPVDITGEWVAEVRYSWGITVNEQFSFRLDQDRLWGTAGFLGVARGIQEGRREGARITFQITFEQIGGSPARVTNTYRGTATDEEIRFTLEDDRGYVPVEFTARRVAPVSE